MSNTPPVRDPLSPLAREVLALFSEALSEVRFPDIDAAVLASGAEGLRAVQRDVEILEIRLDAAREIVAAQSEALNAQAQRALAYARVYADTAPDVARRVAEVGQHGAATASGPAALKRRGRPRKPVSAEPIESLFAVTTPSLDMS